MSDLTKRPLSLENIASSQMSINILLFEDNLGDATYIQHICHAGFNQGHPTQPFELVHVTNLADGLARLSVEQFDIILLDLSLPDSQGLEKLAQLQNQTEQTPIIILTGQNDQRLGVEAVQAGTQDYLVKDDLSATLITRTIRHAVERQQLHQALAANERRFRRIIEQNADGILILNKYGQIQFTNPAAEQILQKTEIRTHKRLLESFSDIVEMERVLGLNQCDGTIAYVDVRIVETTWQQQPAHLISLRDITDRKNMESALALAKQSLERQVSEQTHELRQVLANAEEARDQAEAILDSVADGLIVTDRHNRVVMMNQTASQLLQANLMETINRPLQVAHIHPHLKSGIEQALANKSRSHQFEFEASLSRNGSSMPKRGMPQRIIHARTSIIQGKSGKAIGTVTVLYDITQKRQLDRLKSEFIATVAHELRTPLTSIQGFSEIMLARKLDEATREKYLGYINEQAIALSGIVTDMLDIGLVESGQILAINRQPCHLNQLIEQAVASFTEEASSHQIMLDLAETPVHWQLDSRKLAHVLENLLSNAIKYSPDGGLIKVSRYPQPNLPSGEQVCHITIEDEGIGMSPTQIDHIFDCFYRVDASNTATAGVGIGMSVVKEIVKAHGGEIWVESEPGQGTKVSFSLVCYSP